MGSNGLHLSYCLHLHRSPFSNYKLHLLWPPMDYPNILLARVCISDLHLQWPLMGSMDSTYLITYVCTDHLPPIRNFNSYGLQWPSSYNASKSMHFLSPPPMASNGLQWTPHILLLTFASITFLQSQTSPPIASNGLP